MAKQRARGFRLKLFGEEHSSTADSYHSLGVTQHELGDFSLALMSKYRALNSGGEVLRDDPNNGCEGD